MKLARYALAAAGALLSACQLPPQLPPPAPQKAASPVPPADGIRAFELQQRDKAATLEQQGQLLDAAAAWEVLALLKPGDYQGRLDDLRKRIDVTAQDHLSKARQAFKKGDLQTAEPLYLAVIALQPKNAEAADTLRSIERIRVRRDRQLKTSRIVPANGETATSTAPVGNPLLMEQASNLASQGDVDEAIGLLEGQLKSAPRDQAARDMLVDLYFKKAQALQTSDPAGAKAALKRCLQLAPKHDAGKALLAKLSAAPSSAKPATAARPAQQTGRSAVTAP